MLNRRGQLFLILLCIFTVIVLGTALFLLSQKAAEFNGSIGKQQYGALKLFHANNKFLEMYGSLAQEDIGLAIDDVLLSASRSSRCERSLEGSPFWYIEGLDCAPKILDEVSSAFNDRFVPKLNAINGPRLLKFEDAPSDESLLLKRIDSPQLITYTLTLIPGESRSGLIAAANVPWTFEMQDAAEDYAPIAQIQQYPHFRLSPAVDMMTLHRLELLPARLAAECKGRSSSELPSCVSTILDDLKRERVIEGFESVPQDRDVRLLLQIKGPLATRDINFAVRIPSEGLLFVGPLEVYQQGERLGDSFSLQHRDLPLEIRSTVRVPSPTGATVELCTSPNQEPRVWTCPYKIMENGQHTADASQSIVSEDQRSVDLKYFWSAFPQDRFLIKLKATTATGQSHESQQVISVF